MQGIDRRTALKFVAALLAFGLPRGSWSASTGVPASNFHAVYGDPVQRERFLLFLRNVFHLYPEDRFHALIAEIVARHADDRGIYLELQERLPEIAPAFATLSYALPALKVQKQEMGRQAAALLGKERSYQGYVEIGAPGRYVKPLRAHVEVRGPVWLVNDYDPGLLSPTDVFERGQLLEIGRYVPLGSYEPIDAQIPAASVDLVSNFIGFHHAPPERREAFVDSIRSVLRPGGRLVVRDHDVHDDTMHSMVSLAHDVFNAGVKLSWADNAAQIRNFTSLVELVDLLESRGFERSDAIQFQLGDPTLNGLLLFVKHA